MRLQAMLQPQRCICLDADTRLLRHTQDDATAAATSPETAAVEAQPRNPGDAAPGTETMQGARASPTLVVTVHEFKCRAEPLGHVAEAEERRLCELANIMRGNSAPGSTRRESTSGSGSQGRPSSLSLSLQLRRTKHKVRAKDVHSVLVDETHGAGQRATATTAPKPEQWANVFNFREQVLELPLPAAKGGAVDWSHPLLLTLKGIRGDTLSQQPVKYPKKVAVSKVALSELHMHLTAPSKTPALKESTRNPQVVMAWFKMYTPTVAAAAVGQLRLSLRLVSPAVDAPRQSEVGSDHALARVSAPPPPPPPPPPIAPSADTEPFAHTSVQAVGPAKAHKATSSRAVKPELDISRFQIVTQKRTYVLAAETSKSARFWLEHLRAVLAVLRHGR